MMLRRLLASSAALLPLAFMTPQASAVLVLPNTAVIPNAQPNPLAGTMIVANTGITPFSAVLNGLSISGTVQEWVVRNFAANPFGAGNLSFVYQTSLTGGTSPAGAPILERLTGASYFGFQTDVGYSVLGAGTVVPNSASRSANANVIGFDFIPPGANILLGQTSALLIVNTNAVDYAGGTISVQDGLSANVAGLSPVPEPSSQLLLGAGLLAFLGVWWRRRNLLR